MIEKQAREGSGIEQSVPQPIAYKQLTGKEGQLEESSDMEAAAASSASILGTTNTLPISMPTIQNYASSYCHPDENQAYGTATANDVLAGHLASMSKHQLYHIVSQVKELIQLNHRQAREILIANPQLTKALFQAQIMLGMVKASEPVRDTLLQQHLLPQQACLQVPAVPVTQPPQLISAKKELPQMIQRKVPMGPARPQTLPPTAHQSQAAPSASALSQHESHASIQELQAYTQSPSDQQTQTAASASLPSHPPQCQQQQTSQAGINQNVVTLSHSQSMAVPSLQTLSSVIQHSQLLQSLPPSLPHQPCSLVPSMQCQSQNMQSAHGGLQPYVVQPLFVQGGMMQANAVFSPEQIYPMSQSPTLPQAYQMPGTGGNVGMVGNSQGPSMTSAPAMWNQPTGKMVGGLPQQHPVSGHTILMNHGASNMISMMALGGLSGHSPVQQGPCLVQTQSYSQHPLHHPPQQQPQVPIELEEQKALIQQFMTLTADQINLLPVEQRQQVFQLQQTLHGQFISASRED